MPAHTLSASISPTCSGSSMKSARRGTNQTALQRQLLRQSTDQCYSSISTGMNQTQDKTRCKDRVTRVEFLGLSNCYVRPLLSPRAGLSPPFHKGRQVSFPHLAPETYCSRYRASRGSCVCEKTFNWFLMVSVSSALYTVASAFTRWSQGRPGHRPARPSPGCQSRQERKRRPSRHRQRPRWRRRGHQRC